MDRLEALMADYGWRAVDFAVWNWTLRLDDAETKATVDAALVSDGCYGVHDLVLAGPALGGLDAELFAELVECVEAELRGNRLAA